MISPYHRPSTAFAAIVIACGLAALRTAALQAADVEAYAGAPFGVGRITISVASNEPTVPLEDERFTLSDAAGRALYPVIKEQPVRALIRQLLEIESPRFVTFYFLFRGDEPFELEAFAPSGQPIRVVPQGDPNAHRRLMDEWWDEYVGRWQSLRQDPQSPPLVENFLAANLARRLGRELPEPRSGIMALFAPKKTVWDELFATEAHLLSVDQQLLMDSGEPAGQLQPLPPPMPWYDLPPAGPELTGVAVEPIALHVPAECFYVRFGSFSNYLWFRDLNRKWQGDLGNMIRRRAIDRAARHRIEQQLSLRENALAKILGPQVITDVAIIGLDPYVAQGGAVGILFQAQSPQTSPLLAGDLTTQRREALAKFPDAKETTVRIADRDVSLISNPGADVRSYYVADGDFHLVTTSRRLVQRFLMSGQGEQPLAATTGFLSARGRLPLDREDTAFVYLSPEFFRGLTAPAAWIESFRRTRSAREMKLLELARLQASAEGVAATSVEELKAVGLLPPSFASHSDGTQLVEQEPGPADSLRGRPGYFTPLGDVEVNSATAAETAAYGAFTQRFKQEIGQTPPIAIAAKRTPLADGAGEILALDVLAAPLADVKLGKLPDALGEPANQRVAPVEGDLVRIEAVLDAVLPFGPAEPHHLFAAIRDFRTPLVVRRGELQPGAPPPELVRMYVGAWPKPGLLRMFAGDDLAMGPEPVPAAAEGWQAARDEFLLMSFKPDLIQQVLPQLQMVPVEDPAQLWLEIADLTGTELSVTVSALGYKRTRDTSIAACHLMNTLANQLHVPREECLATAERLVDGKFICPLGGEYALLEVPGGQVMWTSTAIAPENRFLLTEPPADFQLPLLTWFKGLRGDARLDDKEFTAHLEVDMAQSAVP